MSEREQWEGMERVFTITDDEGAVCDFELPISQIAAIQAAFGWTDEEVKERTIHRGIPKEYYKHSPGYKRFTGGTK